MVVMENEPVTLLKPKFYQRHVHDIFNRRKKNTEDFFGKTQKLPTKHQAHR